MENFNILKYNSIFEEPQKIASPETWLDHIPFIFFLIEVLNPSTVVELGTHTGNSFNAICQAVKTLKIKSKCYAVDKWEGDSHAGFYSDEVYDNLSEYQNKHYKSFAQLMRMSFDEALTYFNDGSIDILHIDGFHSYEAVKHDFETWLPKVSDRGVILFHDTFVRRDEFGVWKLWEEICTRYPSFNFDHGFGLGIIAVGKNVNEEFISFLKSANENVFYQNLFRRLGQYIHCRNEFANEHEHLVQKYHEVDRKNAEIDKMVLELEKRDIEINHKTYDLNHVLNSRTWRWGNKIADIFRSFAPKNSKRRKFIKLLFRR